MWDNAAFQAWVALSPLCPDVESENDTVVVHHEAEHDCCTRDIALPATPTVMQQYSVSGITM